MPRQSEAKKDVLICEKRGGVDKKRYHSTISEWGNPIGEEPIINIWIHSMLRRTGRTETSQYPEEKKSTEIL